MAWTDDLLDASFRGVPFVCQKTDDKGEKSLVLHQYPHRSGAEAEDMGRGPRRIALTAFFWGETYREDLEDLIAAFEPDEPGELVHPVFGPVTVAVQNWTISHTELPDQATVTVECIEATPDNPFFAARDPQGDGEAAAVQVEQSFDAALAEAAGDFSAALAELAATAENQITEATALLDDALTILDPLADTARAVYTWVAQPLGFIADLTATVDGVVDRVFAAGDGLGGLASALTTTATIAWRWAEVSSHLPRFGFTRRDPYPTSRGDTWIGGGKIGNTSPAGPLVRVNPTPAPLPKTTLPGNRLAKATTLVVNLAQTRALAGVATETLEQDLTTPRLSPPEVEGMVTDLRTRIQDNLDLARAVLPPHRLYPAEAALRQAALALQTLGQTVLDRTPPLVDVTVKTPCNLHLLAHRLYGSFRRAEQLQRLNPQVRNPNFIAATQVLKGFVK